MGICFLHKHKTGGSTLENTLKLDSLGCNYLSELDPKLVEKNLLVELRKNPITIVNAYARSLKQRLGNCWPEYKESTTFLFTIRNPISLFESDWQYQHQLGTSSKFKSTHLPHDPMLKKKFSGNDWQDIMCDYLERNISYRIDINSYCELLVGQKESKEDDLYNTFSLEIAKETSEFFWMHSNNFYRPTFSCGAFNNQWNTIRTHFGEEIFDIKPLRGGESQVYFLPTELINIALPFYLLHDANLRQFFKKMDLNNPSLELISEVIANLRKNTTRSEFKGDQTMKLTPKNRLSYYKYSDKDYKIWTSAISILASLFNQSNHILKSQ